MCGKSVVVVYVKGVGVYMRRVCVGGCVWCMYRRVCVVCVWEEYGRWYSVYVGGMCVQG